MKLAWRTDGSADAPPLVLLNSLGTTTEMWNGLVGRLAEQFHVIRIDHRGHGASPASPAGTTCTIADLGADVVAVLDDLGLERVHIAGLSLGGMTAQWLAIHHPERIGRLALLCTSAQLAPAQPWLDRAARVRADGMAAIAEPVTARWVTDDLAARDPQLIADLRAMMSSVDVDSYAQCCEAIAALNLRPDLARIAAPTLVVAGAQDLAIPPDYAERLADAIDCADLVILDPAAHVATYDQPARIATLLLDHFRAGATLTTGYAIRRSVLGDEHVDRTVASMTAMTRPFQEFLTRYAWGDVWSRTELSRRERSIVTLAVLVALGADHELAMHLRAAVRNGMAPEEIAEVLMHTALYAGLPRANRAMAIAREVLEAE